MTEYDLINHVAKRIRRDTISESYQHSIPWHALPRDTMKYYLDAAQAAIAAMREVKT